MKQALLFLFFLLTSLSALKAQDLVTITPNPVDTIFEVDGARLASGEPFDLVAAATIVNNTVDTLLIRWERNVVNLPTGWETKICDENLCYVEFVNSNIDAELMLNEPLILEPNSTSNLDVHFVPNGFTGVGKVEVEIALASEPNRVIAIGEYNSEVVTITTSTTQQATAKSIRIYPNPSGDYLTLSSKRNIARMVVYNMVGRAVRSFDVDDNNMYDISGLSNGIYLVSLYDRKGSIIKTLRVSKRNIQP